MMRAIFNQYSYLIASSAFLLATGWRLFRQGVRPRGLATLALVALVLAAGQMVMRTGRGSARLIAELDRIIAPGRPLLIEVYSNY